MVAGREAIAYPILEELVGEIDKRLLDEWESADEVVQPLLLLFRCVNKLGRDAGEKQKIYDRICRLDPAQAWTLSK